MDRYENQLKARLLNNNRLTYQTHKANIHCLRWSPDGAYLGSCGKDRLLCLWRLTESEIICEPKKSNNAHSNEIDQLCWNPEKPTLVATASIDRHVKVWDARQHDDPIASIKLRNDNVAICWSNNGNTIAVADKGDVVTFLDARNGYKTIKDHKFPFEVNEVTWNKQDDLFFITSGDGNIHVLGYPDLTSYLVIDAFASPCLCIRFDSSGRYFAVGSSDAIASIWDTENLACIQAIDRFSWPVKTLSFSHDSNFLAGGSEDPFIDIANVTTGQQVFPIPVPQITITLDFHPKEYLLAYAMEEHDYKDIGNLKLLGFRDKKRGYNI